MNKKKIGVISLGCDKNRVDTEKMLYTIGDFAEITNQIEEANIIVINSCGFLCESRQEAIETVMECNLLRDNNLEKIVLTGCLPQKFIDELFEDLTEVDLFLGVNDYDLLKDGICEIYKGKRVNLVGKGNFKQIGRVLTTPSHYAYLRVADGCKNHCTYCLIPYIRGNLKSVPIEELKEEIQLIGEVKELILVAQDLTAYGLDIYGEPSLVRLIREISPMREVGSIRLLYCYPELISDELIEEIKTNEKIIKYIDVPMQHADGEVLKRMNRKGSFDSYLKLVEKLKQIPDMVIRSTFIAGFPGETEENFENLCEFVKRAKLFNAGFFAYSKEEGTPAFKLDGQISAKVKKERVKKLYAIQKQIMTEQLNAFKGKTLSVVCDGIDYDKQSFYGRAYISAPLVDGLVYFTSDEEIVQGETYKVKITKIKNYDMYGGVVNEYAK